jgi:CubicO group peptidase (beta-lactamase class C family)
MKDTSFSVPADKLARFGSCYSLNPQTKKLDVTDSANGQWSHPPAFPSGGGGLVSTVDDSVAFARMVLTTRAKPDRSASFRRPQLRP